MIPAIHYALNSGSSFEEALDLATTITGVVPSAGLLVPEIALLSALCVGLTVLLFAAYRRIPIKV
jgi:hypothetical protein